MPECFEFILTVLAMIADDLASKVRNKTNQLQRHLLFHIFFFFLIYFLSFTLLCLTDEQYHLGKKKKVFCILYSQTLFKIEILYRPWQQYCRLHFPENRCYVLILLYHNLHFFNCNSIFTSLLAVPWANLDVGWVWEKNAVFWWVEVESCAPVWHCW